MKIIKKNKISLTFLKIIEYIKIIKVEIREDKEEYLEKNKTTNQLTRQSTPKSMEKEKSIPT